MVPEGAPSAVTIWSAPATSPDAEKQGVLSLRQGQVLQFHDVFAGDETSSGTGAEATQLWYRVMAEAGETGWVQAIVPATDELGSDGREASLRFVLVPG